MSSIACLAVVAGIVAFSGVASAQDTTIGLTDPLDRQDSGSTQIGHVLLKFDTVETMIVFHDHNLIFNSALTPGDSVAAGASTTEPTVSNNHLLIQGDAAVGNRYVFGGGISGSGTGTFTVTGNSVKVSGYYEIGHDVNDAVWGPAVIAGAVAMPGAGRAVATRNYVEFLSTSTNNAVTSSLTPGTDLVSIYGALIEGRGIAGGQTANDGNYVMIDGGTFSVPNVISIENISHIVGGQINGSASDVMEIIVRFNKVTVQGETQTLETRDSVFGGYVHVARGTSRTDGAQILDNAVSLAWGEYATGIDENVGGGNGFQVNYATIARNSLLLSGTARVTGNAFGGLAEGTGTDNLASSNFIVISETADVGKSAYGGYVENGDVESNYVSLKGGTVAASAVGGKVNAGDGHATGNHIIVDDAVSGVIVGTSGVDGGIYGAVVEDGDASENYVDITAAVIGQGLLSQGATGTFGIGGAWLKGAASSGNASNNYVTMQIANSQVVNTGGNIFGVKVEGNGSADLSRVVITVDEDGELINGGGDIFAAVVSGTGSAGNSTLRIALNSNGNLDADNVYAAYLDSGSGTGSAYNNQVNIGIGSGTMEIAGDIWGASVAGTGAATYSGVAISVGENGMLRSTNNGGIFGARTTSGSGDVKFNTVSVTVGTDGAVNLAGTNNVVGAELGSGSTADATDNTVAIKLGEDATFNTTSGYIFGATNTSLTSGDMERNHVSITCVSVDECGTLTTLGVAGAMSAGSAKDNSVYIATKLTISGSIYGGTASGGNAENNSVFLSGNGNVTGNIYGGSSTGADALDNEVVLSNYNEGSLMPGLRIYGGRGTGNADRNKITVWNSTLSKSLVGGATVGTGTETANDNRIIIGGEIIIPFPNEVDLIGGQASGGTGDYFHGNNLTFDYVDYATANIFKDISGFETINANVTSEYAKDALTTGSGKALIPANGTIFVGDGTNKTKINVHIRGPEVLSIGSEIRVFDTLAALSSTAWDDDIDFNLTRNLMAYECTGTGKNCEITGRSPLNEAKVLSELPLADISFVNCGADFIASQAIPVAIASVSGTVGVATFATIGYGWSRTETGSHIDVKGVSGDVGFAFGTETSAGPFTAGAFLEFGDGSFDSYNEFAGIPTVHGEGDVSYIGGGVFARLDLGLADSSRPYFEASVRFGKTDADFETADFLYLGQAMKYDMDAKYWGFHAGAGYIVDFSSFDGSLELSAKYFHTHRDGDDFLLDGDRVSLSSVTSSRIKVGGRLNAGFTSTIKGYFGLYYEHEFNGDSQVHYAGIPLPEASLSGSTGVGELGLIVSAPGSPLEFQMGVQGSAGQRDGISANLSFKYTF